MRLNKMQKVAVTALEEIKGQDILVLDVRKLTTMCDTMIIASAQSTRQVKALAGNVRERMEAAARRSSASRARKAPSGCWSIAATSWST
jgi:ribosome-associated protein